MASATLASSLEHERRRGVGARPARQVRRAPWSARRPAARRPRAPPRRRACAPPARARARRAAPRACARRRGRSRARAAAPAAGSARPARRLPRPAAGCSISSRTTVLRVAVERPPAAARRCARAPPAAARAPRARARAARAPRPAGSSVREVALRARHLRPPHRRAGLVQLDRRAPAGGPLGAQPVGAQAPVEGVQQRAVADPRARRASSSSRSSSSASAAARSSDDGQDQIDRIRRHGRSVPCDDRRAPASRSSASSCSRAPPDDLPAGEPIEQGYLAIAPDGVEVRIRRRAGRSTLTVKSGPAHVRVEEELEIDDRRFEALWALTEGRRIAKTRHLVPLDGGADRGGRRLRGRARRPADRRDRVRLHRGERRVRPARTGSAPEVTGDARYANQSLALRRALSPQLFGLRPTTADSTAVTAGRRRTPRPRPSPPPAPSGRSRTPPRARPPCRSGTAC